MSSFSIPLTGLKASSEALNTIANNLSNMNTTAFKSQSVSFSDLFYQQIGTTGSGNPLQVGAGTQVASTATDFSQGGIDSTGNDSDLYIDGNGFFVVKGSDGSTELTRDGNFTTSGGYLVTQNGANVMGYSATNGVVNTSGQLAPIDLPVGKMENAKATTTMSMTANLNASDAVGTTVQGQVPIFDSLGNSHEATVYFTKTATNTWNYSFSLDPKTLGAGSSTAGGVTTYTYSFDNGTTVDPSTSLTISGTDSSGNPLTTTPVTVTPGMSLSAYASALTTALGTSGITAHASGNTLTIAGPGISPGGSLAESAAGTASANASGSLVFDSSGNLVTPSSNVAGIQLGGLTDGAADLSLTWQLYGTSGTGVITQSVETSSSTNPVSGTTQDGYASGTYQGFKVDPSGVVSASFSNGETQVVGQVALANVANLQGLTIEAGNNYAATTASGAPTVGIAGTAGLGTLEQDTLENSNVDISTQFSNLIVAQQAFDASSKAITTFDTISQDTLNMIH